MTTRWLCVLLVMTACDAGRADHCSPASNPLSGPTPRTEFVSAGAPTDDMVRRELGGWYSFPELHTVVGSKDQDDVIGWRRYYDGVEMQTNAVTTKLGDYYITRFQPEYAEPERVRCEQLIGEAKAIAAAKITEAPRVSLLYQGNWVSRQLAGRQDAMWVVASWRLVYRVMGPVNGAEVNAYTGEVAERWNPPR
jgi:hypothetical protein